MWFDFIIREMDVEWENVERLVEWEAPGANVEAVRAAKENMEEKAADETESNWRVGLQWRQNRKADE